MSTPVLTKRQQRHSLSAKKTPVKGLRNVLAQPHDNFWPLVSKCTQLEDLFKKLAPAAKKSQVRWKAKKSKKDKAPVQQKLGEDAERLELARSIVLGINAVTRALERNQVCCVLLDASIDPPFMVKHILIMAQNKGVPVLLLSSLKQMTASSNGVPSAAFGLKNLVKESKDHHFHALYREIEDVFKEVPLPKKLALSTDVEKDEDVEFSEESLPRKEEPKKFTLSTNVYKYRTSRTERAFVPPSARGDRVEEMDCTELITTNGESNVAECPAKNSQAADFISIGHYESDTEEERATDQRKISAPKKLKRDREGVQYLPLKVRRIQGNRNRVKATKAAKPKKK